MCGAHSAPFACCFQPSETPRADPHAGCCGGWGLNAPGYPIRPPLPEFAPYGRDNVPKSLLDPSLIKTNLNDPMNVRELFCPFLQQNDRAGEAETSLKETGLVNDVLPRPHTTTPERGRSPPTYFVRTR